MGFDISNRWVFAGDDGPRCRAALIDRLHEYFEQSCHHQVADEAEADRSLVIGPAGRWIFIGDSAGSTEWADPEGFQALSLHLSVLAPVIEMAVSDSAVI